MDWTVNPETGRTNSSSRFEHLVEEIARMMRSVHVGDDPRSVARLIVAQLAHVHGMVPGETAKCVGCLPKEFP